MLTLNWLWWILLLILGVQGWPVVLCLAAVLLASAALTRGWVRWASLLAALPCVAILGVAAWWAAGERHRDAEAAAFEDRVHQVLERDQVVNGILLPAGTEVRWRDVDRSHLGTAIPPEPITLFGLRVSWIQLADDESDWNLQLPTPEMVGSWTCAEVNVRVSTTGDLRSCRLAVGRDWQGWPIPADSLLDLTMPGKIGLALPIGTSMAAPEVGHNLTATGSFSLNADGSLDQFYFEDDDPLRVAGRRLWNTVQWSYDPATYGQGRRRRAVTVRGSLASTEDGAAGQDVIIRLSDGRVTAAE